MLRFELSCYRWAEGFYRPLDAAIIVIANVERDTGFEPVPTDWQPAMLPATPIPLIRQENGEVVKDPGTRPAGVTSSSAL